MAELKAPLCSFAAQGTFGKFHLSHHNGTTYVYLSNPRSQVPATPLQQTARDDFTDGAERWSNFTAPEKWFWSTLAPRLWRPRDKDCRSPKLTGYQTYMAFWREIEPAPGKALIFLAVWIALALTYGIPMP